MAALQRPSHVSYHENATHHLTFKLCQFSSPVLIRMQPICSLTSATIIPRADDCCRLMLLRVIPRAGPQQVLLLLLSLLVGGGTCSPRDQKGHFTNLIHTTRNTALPMVSATSKAMEKWRTSSELVYLRLSV